VTRWQRGYKTVKVWPLKTTIFRVEWNTRYMVRTWAHCKPPIRQRLLQFCQSKLT